MESPTPWLRHDAEHHANHQPPKLPQWQIGHSSLSLSSALNIFPSASRRASCAFLIASPASPLYPSTVSWYFATSSLMENVEYSAQYHKVVLRWICTFNRSARWSHLNKYWLTNYGFPLSVAWAKSIMSMLCFANVIILYIFYGCLMLRPRLTEVRETFIRGGSWV